MDFLGLWKYLAGSRSRDRQNERALVLEMQGTLKNNKKPPVKYQLYTRTHSPTGFRLEPGLEEVFVEPEKYRRYFKPVLAVDISQILPEETGEVYFLYTTCAIQGSFVFRVREGKYELADYDFSDPKGSKIVMIDDIDSEMDTQDIPL